MVHPTRQLLNPPGGTLQPVRSADVIHPGVIGNSESLAEESHSGDGLLEYPVYTKPAQWRGEAVPEVLLSGDHAKIAQWRREQQLQRTRKIRPDLWAKYVVAQEMANE